MALGPGPLERATEAAREDETGWSEVADRIKDRVGAVRLPSRPIATFTASGEPALADGHPVTVASRELQGAIRSLLQAPTHAPDGIDLTVEAGRLVRVEVDVVATYGEPLLPLLETLRAEVASVVVDHVGPDPSFDLRGDVVVRVVDVVVGDPSLA